MSAILFAALHLDAYAAIGMFLMGMVFALLYETYGNLALNIIVHCVYNSFVFYTLVSMDDIVESESSVLADFITFVVSCAILLLSCRAIYIKKHKKGQEIVTCARRKIIMISFNESKGDKA
ncbi:MAG: CPBP family intramembrane metalloprotease [Firmicutes bacterium]|nr:CPBP family intramembrane metalloprotease [Bacillota bacterium]